MPDDPEHVMYVWFDALINYISTLGWPEDANAEFKNFWPGTQIAGKDNLRQQSAMWQAMLMSAKLPLSKQILIQGFIGVDGQKMSKSLGNVIAPKALVEKYGTDPVRYYLLREIPSGEDGDFSYEKFEQRYNGDLANGLGNLVARVATLGEKVSSIRQPYYLKADEQWMLFTKSLAIQKNYEKHIQEFRLNEALADIWELIGIVDKFVNDEKPWTKERDGLLLFTQQAAFAIDTVRIMLEPFLPETARKISEQITVSDSEIIIKKAGNLFPRIG